MPGLAATGVLNHTDEVVCIDALARRSIRC
jgi:hypothetical protein